MAETKAKTGEKVGEEVEKNTPKARIETVNLETSVSQLVEWDTEGVQLVFDQAAFLQLPEGVVKQLKKQNRDAYFVARQNAKNLTKAPIRKPRQLKDPFTNAILRRLKARKKRYFNEKDRKEYHQTFVDVAFVDEFKAMGYRPVRREENDEILYLMQGDKPEAMLMEVPWPEYEAHLHAMAEKSKEAYTTNKQALKERMARYGGTLYDEEDEGDRERMAEIERRVEAMQ